MHPAQHETERSDQTTPAIADDDPIRWPDPSPLDLWWQRVMADTIRRCRAAEPRTPGRGQLRPVDGRTERNRVAG
nr:hypothetical protein GCM10017611_78140 [Rhodococcus wratislaviensis]